MIVFGEYCGYRSLIFISTYYELWGWVAFMTIYFNDEPYSHCGIYDNVMGGNGSSVTLDNANGDISTYMEFYR